MGAVWYLDMKHWPKVSFMVVVVFYSLSLVCVPFLFGCMFWFDSFLLYEFDVFNGMGCSFHPIWWIELLMNNLDVEFQLPECLFNRLIMANVSEFTTIQISPCTSIQRLWILLAIRQGKCLAFWLEKLTLGTSLCLRQNAYSMGKVIHQIANFWKAKLNLTAKVMYWWRVLQKLLLKVYLLPEMYR